jgi:subtilisin family serine protease
MGSAATSAKRKRPNGPLWIWTRGGILVLAALCVASGTGFAAGLLGGSHGSVGVPTLSPLPSPGVGSTGIDSTGTGSTAGSDTGTLLGPSFSVPLSSGTSLVPLNQPALPSVSDLTTGLPLGIAPDLQNLPQNVLRDTGQVVGEVGRTIRKGFVLPPVSERRFVPNEAVLDVPSGMSLQTFEAIVRRHRLTPLASQSFSLTGHTLYRVRIEDARGIADIIRELAGEQRLSAAQPNFTFTLQGQVSPVPSEGDPAQYAAVKLHLAEAHRLARGDNVLVAVIDSGIDVSHPELAGIVAASFDASSSDTGPHPHGTAMAGAIAAHGRLIGVAPHVRLLAIRAFGAASSREGTTFDIIRGLDWAVEHGARVVNMSFAGPADVALQEALAKARKKGVVLVAAAGNAGPRSPPAYPAADPNVIAVTATDVNDNLFAQANRGNYVALAAPGVDILGPAPNGGVQLSTGTSVAAAHVSGIAALILERKPSLRPDEVRKILTGTAKHFVKKPRDSEYGAGLADALEAVSALQPKSAAK